MCPIHNAVDTFTVSSSLGFVSHFNYVLLFLESVAKQSQTCCSSTLKKYLNLVLNNCFINLKWSLSSSTFREEIVIWARKKTGVPVIRLSSINDAEEFLRQHQIFVIGLFEKYEVCDICMQLNRFFLQGPEHAEFVKAATTDNEVQFVETNDVNVAKVLFPEVGTEKKFIGLVKSEPERYEKFGKLLTEFKNVPSAMIMFVYVDNAEDNLAKPFLTLYGLEAEKPIVSLQNHSIFLSSLVTAFDNRIGSKYLLESDLTRNTLEMNNYPTLVFYPAGDKSNPIKVPKKSSLKELIAFINKNIRSDEDGRGITDSDHNKKDEL
ncbi:hypothetical protein B296_00003075 [Ensete ventricosum]|uniref:Thioredoxin domain-containing protein n=1 Tax=Ensete ventricosum TaxID=4639 RepID=A0A427AR12_ENSVE|nr:hypothetical protein B296_00003075 [Ensete ventricosum]